MPEVLFDYQQAYLELYSDLSQNDKYSEDALKSMHSLIYGDFDLKNLFGLIDDILEYSRASLYLIDRYSQDYDLDILKRNKEEYYHELILKKKTLSEIIENSKFIKVLISKLENPEVQLKQLLEFYSGNYSKNKIANNLFINASRYEEKGFYRIASQYDEQLKKILN